MTNMNKSRPFIMCADFETCASGTKFAKEHDDTFIYAMNVMTVPLFLKFGHATTLTPWQPTKYIRGWNRQKHYINKMFGDWDDFLNYLLPQYTGNQTIYLYFHNGQKFDFVFIQKWLINHHWYRALTKQDEEECISKGINYYVWDKASNWNSGILHFKTKQGYLDIELRDTIKIQPGSIKEIGEDLFGEHGTYKDDIKTNPWFKDLNLNKQPLDINYIQDKQGDMIYCSDGYKYPMNSYLLWPKMIRERVGSDVAIMVGLLYYYILNQVINPQNYSNNICLTTGQVAIKSYFLDVIKSVSKSKKDKEGDIWAKWYKSNWDTRFNEYLLLEGQWDLLDEELNQVPKIARGGFTNGMDSIKGKVLHGEFLSFDVNSEYPFISTFNCPCGAGVEMNLKDLLSDETKWGVIWFRAKHVKQLVSNVPAMLLADWQATDSDDQEIYKYEIDNFDGVLTKQEWQVFMDEDYFEWEDIEVYQVFGWDTKPLLKDFMETNYLAKQKASKEHNKTAKLVAKLKLNSLTGKFSQKLLKVVKLDPETFTYDHLKKQLNNIKGLDDDMKQTLDENSFRYDKALARKQNLQVLIINECEFANTSIYSFITGGGRAWIQSHMLELGWAFQDQIKVLYGDTDSMKIWVKSKEIKEEVLSYLADQNLLNDDKLGCFKEEFNDKVKSFKYLCPKKYLCGDEDENIITSKSALSGLKWDNVLVKYPHPKLNDISVGSKFLTLKPRVVSHGVLLEETEYVIKD